MAGFGKKMSKENRLIHEIGEVYATFSEDTTKLLLSHSYHEGAISHFSPGFPVEMWTKANCQGEYLDSVADNLKEMLKMVRYGARKAKTLASHLKNTEDIINKAQAPLGSTYSFETPEPQSPKTASNPGASEPSS